LKIFIARGASLFASSSVPYRIFSLISFASIKFICNVAPRFRKCVWNHRLILFYLGKNARLKFVTLKKLMYNSNVYSLIKCRCNYFFVSAHLFFGFENFCSISFLLLKNVFM
jgi:hypothetical protein